ncbi:hypothetical protein AHAS_Ahas06G0043900 [Arachis hypogaea]
MEFLWRSKARWFSCGSGQWCRCPLSLRLHTSLPPIFASTYQGKNGAICGCSGRGFSGGSNFSNCFGSRWNHPTNSSRNVMFWFNCSHKTVIKTKSVEYMPFLLSLFMFLNAGAWALYSLLVRDFYIGIPNFVGLILGLAQITVYLRYKEKVRAASEKGNMVSAMEMGAYGYECEEKPSKTNTNGYDGGAIKVAEKTLKKANSLPKPTLNREQTIERVLQKALSFGEYNDDHHHDDVYSIIQLINFRPRTVA